MSLTSPQQVVVMEFGKWNHITDFCPCQLLTDLLWTCYGETGVMEFGKTCYGEVANLLQTRYGETVVMDIFLICYFTALSSRYYRVHQNAPCRHQIMIHFMLQTSLYR